MSTRFFSLLSGILLIASALDAQVPSVQLKIKESTGFLGMGGPRTVKIELSNQSRVQPLTSDNVNGGDFYYFLVSPVEDWRLMDDFVSEELSKVVISQADQKFSLTWKGEIIAGGNNAILVGYPKNVKLNVPVIFQYATDDNINSAECKIPEDLWPGYAKITDLLRQALGAATLNQFRSAIGIYEQILSDPKLAIFPDYEESKNRRTQCFNSLNNQTTESFQSIATNSLLDLKLRIATIDSCKPIFQFVADSLPRAEWKIGSLDSAIAPILSRCRSTLLQVNTFRDSLQRVLDDQNVKWIIEGSATGKNGYLYVYIIETLASAFSILNFADTSAPELNLKISEELQTKLEKYNLVESYNTFTRICNERYQTHLTIFPVDFLPNLKKDSLSFPLPYYSMLKAVNDYYYGNYASARKEIYQIFRTSYEQDFNSRFDMMRVIINIRERHVSPEIIRMLEEADQAERARDIQGATEKFRQLTVMAPDFAYGFYMFGKFYNRSGDFIRAIYSYQQAYQIDSLYLSAYRECYNLYLKQSNFKEIINVYTYALSKGNNYWEINYNLGIALLGEADPARAIQSFQRALALNPKSYKTNIQIGLAYQNMKNFQKARDYFNNAIGLDPTRQEAVDYLAKLNELQRSGK